MVGILELVLNNHLASGAGFLRIDVDVERTHRRLGLYELELDANGGAQRDKVGLLGEPPGEIERLVRPHVVQFDLLELVEVVFHLDSFYAFLFGLLLMFVKEIECLNGHVHYSTIVILYRAAPTGMILPRDPEGYLHKLAVNR